MVKPASYLIIILIPIFLFLTNVLFLTFNRNYYFALYEKLDIYQSFDQKKQAQDATDELLAYLRGEKELEHKFFSTQAKMHLVDVKNLAQTAFIVDLVLLLVLILAIAKLKLGKNWPVLKQSIVKGSTLSIFASLIILPLAVFGFSYWFEKFHLLFFRNKLWLFDAGDNLIKLFPQQFFYAFFLQIILNTTVCAILLLLVVKFYYDCCTD